MMKKIYLIIFFIQTFFLIYTLNDYAYLLEKGVEEFNKAQYDFAINSLNRYIQFHPEEKDKPKAYFYLGLSYYNKKNYDFSFNTFTLLTTKYKFSDYAIQSYFWLGLICKNQEKYKEAVGYFNKFIENDPNSPLVDKAYIALTDIQIKLSKFNDAEKSIKKVVEKTNILLGNEEAFLLYTYLLIKQGKEEEATALLENCIEQMKNNEKKYLYFDRFWLYQGELAFNRNDISTASKCYKNIDIYSSDSSLREIALFRLLQLEEKKGDFINAEKYLKRLQLEFQDSKYSLLASFYNAVQYISTNEINKAITILEEIKDIIENKLNSSNDEYLNNLYYNTLFYLSESYAKIGNYQQGINIIKNITTINHPLSNRAKLKYIEYNINNSNYEEALNYFNKYKKILSEDAELKNYFLLIKSNIEYIFKEYSTSLSTLEQLSLSKKNIDLYYELKYKNLIKLKKFNEAIEIIKEQIKNSKEIRIELYLKLINLYFNTSDFDNVIKEAGRIKESLTFLKNEEKIEAQIKLDFQLALSHMMKKDYKKGISIFENLVANYRHITLKAELNELILLSYYYLGWMNYKNGEINKAVFYFEQSKNMDIPKQFKYDSYFMNGWCYFSMGNYAKSKEIFENIYKQFYPEEIAFKAYFYVGKSLFNMNEKEKALKIFNELYYNLPENNYKEESLAEIIINKIENKKIQEADLLLKEFERKFPKSILYPMLLIKEAEVLRENEKYSEAYSIYQYIIKKELTKENKDIIYYWFSYCAYKIKDYTTSTSYLSIIIEKYKDSSFYNEAINLLSQIYLEEKNYKNLELLLTDILKTEKNKKRELEYKELLEAISLIKSGKDEKEAFLIVKGKKDINAKYELANYYYNIENFGSALSILQEIIEKDKETVGTKALILTADIAIKQNEYQKALSSLIKIFERPRSSLFYPETLYKMAFCYYKIEDIENLKKIIKKLKETFPDNEWTKKAIELEGRIK